MGIYTEFSKAIDRVIAQGEKLQRLSETTRINETAALRDIIAKVKPVMRYIDYPVETSYYHSGHQMHEADYTYYGERGIVLVDDFSRKYTDRDYRGEYTGRRLVLTRSGSLVEFVRAGRWSNWQGEECEWWTESREYEDLGDALEAFELKDIVSGMVEAFKRAITQAQTKEEKLEGRLKALEEIKEIL